MTHSHECPTPPVETHENLLLKVARMETRFGELLLETLDEWDDESTPPVPEGVLAREAFIQVLKSMGDSSEPEYHIQAAVIIASLVCAKLYHENRSDS